MPLEMPKKFLDKILDAWRARAELKKEIAQAEAAKPLKEEDFNFACLFEDEPAGNFWRFIPVINTILLIITIILLAAKK